MHHGIPARDADVARLVERQMRNWELSRAQREPAPKKGPRVRTYIAVSRAVGAGGTTVANLLGERLGWPVFDKRILDVMAGDDRVRRQLYEFIDERDQSWFEETTQSIVYGAYVANDYFRRLTETILAIAQHEHAIFLGRAADLILPPHTGMCIRIVAPLKQRIARIAELTGLDEEAAGIEVARIGREREDFIRHHFRREPGDMTRHDLIVDLETFEADDAVELIVQGLAMWRQRRGISEDDE
jgi:cytidylate kinase